MVGSRSCEGMGQRAPGRRQPTAGRLDVHRRRLSTLLAVVGENPQAAPAPELHPAVAQLDAGGDDDLVAGGSHLLDRRQRQDRAARHSPPLRLRPAGLDRDDLAIGERAEGFDDIAVVFETVADEVGEKRARVAVRCECRLYGAVLLRSANGNGDDAPPSRAPTATPLTRSSGSCFCFGCAELIVLNGYFGIHEEIRCVDM